LTEILIAAVALTAGAIVAWLWRGSLATAALALVERTARVLRSVELSPFLSDGNRK